MASSPDPSDGTYPQVARQLGRRGQRPAFGLSLMTSRGQRAACARPPRIDGVNPPGVSALVIRSPLTRRPSRPRFCLGRTSIVGRRRGGVLGGEVGNADTPRPSAPSTLPSTSTATDAALPGAVIGTPGAPSWNGSSRERNTKNAFIEGLRRPSTTDTCTHAVGPGGLCPRPRTAIPC